MAELTPTQKELLEEFERDALQKLQDPLAYTPENISKTAREQVDGETPQEEGDEDVGVIEDVTQGTLYGLSEGLGSMYELGQRFGNAIEEDVVNRFFETEYDFIQPEEFKNPFDKPKTVAGDIASGVSQFGIGMIPAFRIVKLGGGIAKTIGNWASMSKTLTKGTTNLLNTQLGKRAVSVAKGKSARIGAAAAVAEQLTFDPYDPRLGDLAASTEIPIVKDIGELLKVNKDNPEIVERLKMAAEGFGIGVVVEKGIAGVTFLGKTVASRVGKKTKSGKMTIDELEKLSTEANLPNQKDEVLNASGKLRIKEALEKKGYDLEYINKYIGSINLNRIDSSQWEVYNLINETGEALKRKATEAKQKWPPEKGNQKSLEEAASLLNHDSVDTMQNVLLENDALLKVVTDGNGVIQLGGGLEGATAYALAARQLLLDTVDVTFDLAKKIKEAREANVPTTDLRAAYVQQLFAFETIQSTVNNIANESGRLMQSFNVNIGNTAKSKFLSEMLDTAGKDIDELIEGMTRSDIRSVEDRIKTFKNMQEEDGPLSKIKSAIGEYWYNSILSAPDTNIVNTFGNLGVQLARTVIEGTIGATRGQLRLMGSALTGSNVDPASVMTFGDVYNRIRGMSTGKFSGGEKARLGATIDVLSERGFKHPVVVDAMILDVQRGMYKVNGKVSTDFEEVVKNYEGKDGKTRGYQALYNETKDKILHDYGASLSNMGKTLKLFRETFRTEVAPDPRYSRYEIGEAASNRAIPTVVGRFVRLPTTTMSAFDTMFKSIADNAALYEAAYKQVRAMKYEINKNGGSYTMNISDDYSKVTDRNLSPRTRAVKIGMKKKTAFWDEDRFIFPGMKDTDNPKNLTASEMVEYLVANPTKRMLDDAEQEMLEATFQQQNWATKAGEGFRRTLNKSGIGLGTALMPFVRTPLNLLAYTLERTPFGLLSKEAFDNRAALKRLSKVDQSDLTKSEKRRYRALLRREEAIKDKRINKQITGMTYLTGAYFAAQTGMITGGGPTDFTERRRLMESGWRPYSYVINGKYYPISRLDPFSQIAGLAADFQFITNELAQAELTPAERRNGYRFAKFVFSKMTQNIINMISDKTYLKSMGEIMSTLYSPRSKDQDFVDTGIAAAAKTGGSIIGGIIPNVLSRTAELEVFAEVNPDGTKKSNFFYDPIIQDAYIDMDAFRLFVIKATSKIPGVRKAIGEADENLKFYPRITEFGSTLDRERSASILAGTEPAERSVMSTILGDTFISRPGHREDTADLSATLASLGIKPKITKTTMKLPGSNKTIKIHPLVYYNLSKKEGIAYRQGLEELFDSRLYKNLLKEANDNPSRKEAIDNVRRDLIEKVKSTVVAQYKAELYNPDVLEFMGVTDTKIFNAIADEQTVLRKEYFLKQAEMERLLR
tara:strand:+ start:3476 stop:7681 length:4206 start_codon:yes stop_codon:yes gene_type:complete